MTLNSKFRTHNDTGVELCSLGLPHESIEEDPIMGHFLVAVNHEDECPVLSMIYENWLIPSEKKSLYIVVSIEYTTMWFGYLNRHEWLVRFLMDLGDNKYSHVPRLRDARKELWTCQALVFYHEQEFLKKKQGTRHHDPRTTDRFLKASDPVHSVA